MNRRKTTPERPGIFAIGDLHLPGGDDKPMNVFGAHWDGHFERIGADWREKVENWDTVLIPGDISWAMSLEHAVPDLNAIGALPGKKIILRGNHDYWWSSLTRVRGALPINMYAIQNDAMKLDGVVYCGSRGWQPGTEQENDPDRKIYDRELIRLEMSLQSAAKLREGERLVALVHYPPVEADGSDTPVSVLMEKYAVSDVVYGHIHGAGTRNAFRGEKNGVRYHFVSCDGLDFKLLQLPDE